ncbi:MAG: 2-isopropylmalate synthase [Prevotellaceae bacterium]|jgi:D-citramalate synthase|nr:2-isopropylmalate synthase [Prevotellaceae bacterium]
MIEILDTTLRDGEQTSGVSFSSQEKLSIAQMLLEELRVDRIEVASARVSAGEAEGVQKITAWAQKKDFLHRVEVLGFIDGGVSLQWIFDAGCRVMNLLAKGSLKHLSEQLKKMPEEHILSIKKEVENAQKLGVTVNLYLEDWSNGMIHSPEYVFQLIDGLKDTAIKRFMLPDTLGILTPAQTFDFCSQIVKKYPELHFDFHPHNDYDLAVANAFSAVEAGVKGIHCTVNGLGERAGNAPLTSILAVLHDQLKLKTNLREDKIYTISKMVESYSGIRIPNNKPVIGDNVFTQVAGIHADGDSKNNLYFNDLMPERFGRTRAYALGKTSGRASIKKNLEAMGIELDDETMRQLTQRVIELGDKKQVVTPEELPYIIADMKNEPKEQRIKLINYSLSLAKGLRPMAIAKIEINGETYENSAAGDGQYNAFSKVLWKIYTQLGKPKPELLNYEVNIPPGGRTDALVQTTITWKFNDKIFKTNGLDPDQTVAAIKATFKMLNMIEE